MPSASVPNNFSNNTAADAEEVDANFAALVSYINTNCVLKDASVAFTAVPSGPATDPATDNEFARKAYVDAAGVATECRLYKSTTLTTSAATLASWTETADTSGFYAAADDEIIVPTGEGGWYAIWLEVEVSLFNLFPLSVSLVGTHASDDVEYRAFGEISATADITVISYVAYLAAGDKIRVTAACGDSGDTGNAQQFKLGVLKLS